MVKPIVLFLFFAMVVNCMQVAQGAFEVGKEGHLAF
jgi:hypothetical protein